MDIVVVGGMGHRAGLHVYARLINKAASNPPFPATVLLQPKEVPSRVGPSTPELVKALSSALEIAESLKPTATIVACNSAERHLLALPNSFASRIVLAKELVKSLDGACKTGKQIHLFGRPQTVRHPEALVGDMPCQPVNGEMQTVIESAVLLVKNGEIEPARRVIAAVSSTWTENESAHVVLVCSELSLLQSAFGVFGKNVTDSMDVLIEAALRASEVGTSC